MAQLYTSEVRRLQARLGNQAPPDHVIRMFLTENNGDEDVTFYKLTHQGWNEPHLPEVHTTAGYLSSHTDATPSGYSGWSHERQQSYQETLKAESRPHPVAMPTSEFLLYHHHRARRKAPLNLSRLSSGIPSSRAKIIAAQREQLENMNRNHAQMFQQYTALDADIQEMKRKLQSLKATPIQPSTTENIELQKILLQELQEDVKAEQRKVNQLQRTARRSYTDPMQVQVFVKPDVLENLHYLMNKYSILLATIRKMKLSEEEFSGLKLFLSASSNLSFEQCTSLHAVVDLLIEQLGLYIFNIDTLVKCGYIYTIKHSVQEYKQHLNNFLSSTNVKEFIDTLQTGMESFTLRLDKGVDEDYMLRALRKLVYYVTGVDVIAEQVFEVEGEEPHSLQWAEHGFSMHIPEHSLLPNETCAVVVKAIVGGNFQFPADTEPVSAVYSIFLSKPLHHPARIQLQHCVMLNDPECLTFAVGHGHSTPYIFYEVPRGNFERKSFFGWIGRQQFSFVTTLRRRLRNRRVERNNPIQYSA